MTPENLAKAINCPLARAQKWMPFIDHAMKAYGIDTDARVAAFLANVVHESGRLAYVRELWGPTPAQQRYEGRIDLGNTQPGDGRKFCGRGLIQVTGRKNYEILGAALKLPLLDHPELLEQPGNAADSAGWFWATNKLNAFADAGDFDGACDKVNFGRKTLKDGDSNGYVERYALWKSLKLVLQGEQHGPY